MKWRFTIFSKQIAGFLAVLTLAAALAVVALQSFSRINDFIVEVLSGPMDIKNHALMAESELRRAMVLEKRFLIDLDNATVQRFKQALDSSQSHVAAIMHHPTADTTARDDVSHKAWELNILIDQYYRGFGDILWEISLRTNNGTMGKMDNDFVAVLRTDGAVMNIYATYSNKAEAASRLAGVIVRQSDAESATVLASLHQTMRRSATTLLLITAIALVMGIIIAIVLARMFSGSVVRLRNAAREVAMGNHTIQVTSRSNDELNDLADSFNMMVQSINTMFSEVEIAKNQSDTLLLNVLPNAIAERLKSGETLIADVHDNATILFADIVGFTRLSAQHSAVEIVQMLNWIFSIFDRLSGQYGLEKIKTIGDSYMLAGGVPLARADNLEATAAMALDILKEISDFATQSGLPIQVRIGIHTGSVVAGVIGEKKFIYDLWGDTVNIASRMESSGEPGRIQVSEEAYQRLSSVIGQQSLVGSAAIDQILTANDQTAKYQFVFEPRGEIEVKGKGLMRTYFLLEKSSP